ncbi:MAG: 7,8-dihydro-8-oxoguanine triphosphatase [Deltaproteobacteria bacterium]|nr:MAG: 7,8-dihydro-8-oxoguanine triphosphatase [Deltaproteobacteria bacterium]
MYTPIIGTLGYVLSPDKKKTLLVHRNRRQNDQHLGKYNGLGGKMEPEEDVYHCMVREIHEEAGISCLDVVLRGIINWTGFGPDGEDWLGFIFRIDRFCGEPFTANEEGDLLWVELSQLGALPMWEGDRHFLPMVFDDDPRIFHGYMPYAGGKPLDWQWTRR